MAVGKSWLLLLLLLLLMDPRAICVWGRLVDQFLELAYFSIGIETAFFIFEADVFIDIRGDVGFESLVLLNCRGIISVVHCVPRDECVSSDPYRLIYRDGKVNVSNRILRRVNR